MEGKGKYVDEIFHFKGEWEMPSLCGLHIRHEKGRTLVILTEMYEENPGNSVTGMIEKLATEVVKKYEVPPGSAEFIVHNPQRSSKYEFFAESFYLAKMVWDGERYVDVVWEKLEALPIAD
jgi:hypothetical protein